MTNGGEPGRGVKAAALILLLSLPLLMILLAEGAGRLYIHAVHGEPGKSYGIYKAHPRLGAILREESYNLQKVFNNRGFQGREPVPAGAKPPGELRLIAYGGSTTFCYNLPTGEDWPLRLEAKLRERGVAARMLNAGDVSWSLGHINLRTREEFPSLEADWVVLYSGINELTNARLIDHHGGDFVAAVAAGEVGPISTRLGPEVWLFRHSLLYKGWLRWVVPRLPRFTRQPTGGVVNEAEQSRFTAAVDENYRHLLRELIAFWRGHGARVLFVVQAVADADNPNAFRAAVSRRGAATAAAAGAYVVDAAEVFEGFDGDPRELFIESGVHWNREGAERLATLLADRLPRTESLRGVGTRSPAHRASDPPAPPP